MTHSAVAYDFTNVFPHEINEIIWDYLSKKDLLNATLTCKSWNEAIGQSDSFKKRIIVNVSNFEREKQIFKFNKSSREYEIVNIRQYRKPSDLNHLRFKEWNKVFFNIAKIKSQSKFIEVITENFPLVRELKIMNVSIKELSKNANISLPNLERLTFSDISLDVLDIFITHHPCLKALSLRFIYKDLGHESTVGGQIKKFLQINKQIREMEMYEDVSNDFLKSSVGVELKLKTLVVGLNESSHEAQENLIDFLKSQGNSLQNLTFFFHQKVERQEGHRWGYWEPRNDEEETKNSLDLMTILKAWNELKILEKLTLRFLKNSEDFEMDESFLKTLQANHNIQEINLKHINCQLPWENLQTILKLAPSVRKVYVSKINSRIFRFLATKFKLLRKIEFAMEDGDCKKEYEEMIAEKKCDNKLIVISRAYLG